MLTGKRVFTGDTVSDVLARILEREPDWDTLPESTPSEVRRLLRRCLVKGPRERLRDIGEARIVLGEVEREGESMDIAEAIRPALSARFLWRWLPVAFVAGLVVAALALSTLLRPPEPSPRPVRRFTISLPPDAPFQPSNEFQTQHALALSPDGTWLVYVAKGASEYHLMRRRLDSLEAEPIAGTVTSQYEFGAPFFSPDSRWLGFTANSFLKKVNLAGGLPEDLCKARFNVNAAWQDDGFVVYSSIEPIGIYRVPEEGGVPQPVTLPDRDAGEGFRGLPEPLPGGKGMLLTVFRAAGIAGRRLAVLDLDSHELRILADRVPFGRYAPTGHVVYPQQGRLMAMPFDVDTLTATGEPVEVTEPGMGVGGRDPLEWAFSNDGTLVYAQVRTDLYLDRSLVLVDRDGRETPAGFPAPAPDNWALLSPDGRRLASSFIDDRSGEWDVWVYDLETGGSTRITDTPGLDGNPLWAPDGERLVFASSRAGPVNLFWIDAHGGRAAERLTESEYSQYPWSWSHDGKVLFYVEQGDPDSGADLWTLSFEEDPPQAMPLLQSPYDEHRPAISPDGRWLAYISGETGTSQIWMQPFPAMDRKWPVSIDGGRIPVWHPRGDSIFFFDLEGRLMEARVQTQPTLSVERPGVVLDGTWGRWPNFQLDITPDGERFLLVKAPPQEDITELIVVENWFEVLKRKAPPGNIRPGK
jgi:serine/threonine-protein kinase